MPALQHHVVALQAAGEVVPGGGDHGVFALQVVDELLGRGLWKKLDCDLTVLRDSGTRRGFAMGDNRMRTKRMYGGRKFLENK